MKPVHQTKFGNKNGNCLAACVASIFELDIKDVPNFVEEHDWFQALARFSKKQGYTLHSIIFTEDDDTPDDIKKDMLIPCVSIVSGVSPRSGPEKFLHAVVYGENKEMIHDPHPDGKGILTLSDQIVFVAVDPSAFL